MVKQEVLAALDAARGRYISGQELAAQLDVSRTAVWKAVAALRRDGIPIKAVTNRGYTLAQSVDVLNAAAVAAQLDEATVKALQIEVVDRLPGTNAALRSRADAGAREGLVLIAQAQSAGRGRGGHSFYSPPGGLYMSILLRPEIGARQAVGLTAMAAVAAARAAERLCGVPITIKWVNDLWKNGKKVCGILTEAGTDMESGQLEWLVVGIGLNLTVPEDHLPTDKATSLQLVAHGLPDSMTLRDMIAAHLVDGLRSRLADFEADPHREATRAMEEMRPVCWTLGKPCEAHFVDGTTLRGTALELNPDASLTIRDDNGNLHTVRTADVGVLPQ